MEAAAHCLALLVLTLTPALHHTRTQRPCSPTPTATYACPSNQPLFLTDGEDNGAEHGLDGAGACTHGWEHSSITTVVASAPCLRPKAERRGVQGTQAEAHPSSISCAKQEADPGCGLLHTGRRAAHACWAMLGYTHQAAHAAHAEHAAPLHEPPHAPPPTHRGP